MKKLCLFLLCFAVAGCGKPDVIVDNPRLSPDARLTDTIFYSNILKRDMHLRVIAPISAPAPSLSIILLLHGAGQDYRDWSNHSDIAAFSAPDRLLVMPDEAGSYYINEATGADRRYEDYLMQEVMPEIHRQFAVSAQDRSHTAIIGISRGGYGAAVLGFKHPDTFGFIGILSGALDFPERGFRYQTPLDSLALQKVFGPMGSTTRKTNDPYRLAAAIPNQTAPYIFMSCGETDSLYGVNKRFASLLAAHKIPFEFHAFPGGHNWSVWNSSLPQMESAFDEYRTGKLSKVTP